MKNKKGTEALKRYHEKIKSGEIKRPIAKNPIEKAKQHPKSLRFAINAKCWDCAGFQRIEVTRCTIPDCPLYHLRPWQRK